MAQVKFHSVDKSKYDSIETKGEGDLYFISDNGEIRKGSTHITGTRVYNAVDSTGTTRVENLTITFNGTSITSENFPADNKPKKGDMLVVTHYLTTVEQTYWELNGEEVAAPQDPNNPPEGYEQKIRNIANTSGPIEHSAYIYGTDGKITVIEDEQEVVKDYNPSGWQACDGNVDASKVILTQNFTLAGDYDKVGNIARSSNTFETNGLSVAAALERVFTKELDNSSKNNPTFSLTGSNVSLEVGSVHPATTYTATWSDGSYGYKAYWGEKDLRTETGTTVGTWTISAYKNKTAENATISGNTASITTTAFTVENAVSTQMVSFSVTNNLTNTKNAATNLGKEGTVKITAGSIGAQTRSVTGFRYWFYGSNVTPKDYTTVDGSGNATVAVNDNIRALTKVTSLPSMGVVQNATQVVIAIPSNKTLKKVTDGGALNAEITGNFILHNVKVGGADSETGVSIGSYPGDYKVYVMTPSAPLDARTYTITIN